MKSKNDRIQELFFAALDYDSGNRARFFQTACSGDPQLRDELQTLIDAHRQSEEFLETSPYLDIEVEPDETTKDATVQFCIPAIGRSIGSYRLLDRIDKNGANAVYRALQENTSRIVAVKFLSDVTASSEQRRRFEYESTLLGRLKHPGIAHIYEAGVYASELGDCHPFFSMEYIDGVSVTEYAAERKLDVRDRLDLLREITEAVHYAHRNRVIHRDIKPSNVFVEKTGQVKVLDFGIARAIEPEDDARRHCTSAGQILGTIPYLSPEQCRSDEVDTRADVYALGALGYQLLAGHEPYAVQGRSVVELMKIIQEEDPVSLGRVDRAFKGDIETIISKAMAKDKARRYESAAELAEDLKRHLDGEAIKARSDSPFYVLRKIARKHRALTATIAVVLLAVFTSTVLISFFWSRADAQRMNAREAVSLTHSILGMVIQQFEDAVRPLAGGMQVSDQVLAQVDEDLERLRPLVESDDALKDVLMNLREKQGDIAHLRGRHAEAADHYNAFLQISRRLAENAPEEEANSHRLNVARAHRKLGRVVPYPRHQFERAIELCELEINRDPNSLEANYELGKTKLEFAQHLFSTAAYEAAAQPIDDAVSILDALQVQDHEDDRRMRLQLDAYRLRGRNSLELADERSSLESLNKSLEIGQSLIEKHPADTEIRFAVMRTHVKLGIVHHEGGRFQDAKDQLQNAIEIGEYLTKVDPSIIAWRAVHRTALHELAWVFHSVGEIATAQSHSDLAVSLAEDLIEAEPQNATWRRYFAISKVSQGFLLASRKAWPEASDVLEDAKTILQELLEADPRNTRLKINLAQTFDSLGKCSRKLDRQDAALDYYIRAYEIRQALYEEQPEVSERILDLIQSKTKLATWHFDQKTHEGDVAGKNLLEDARTFLMENHEAGRLAGHQRRFDKTLNHIDGELARIKKITRKKRPAEP